MRWKIYGKGIYPYKDYSSLKIDISEGDYTSMIKTRAKWQRIEGLLSGGKEVLLH